MSKENADNRQDSCSINDSMNLAKSSLILKVKVKEQIVKQLRFEGDQQHLKDIVGQLTPQQINNFETCQIKLIGKQIKKDHPKCFFFTFILGVLCLFPFLLFCCNWWKQLVSQIFIINQKSYQMIARVLKGKRLRRISLHFEDNFMSRKKIHILYLAICQTNVAELEIRNMAGAFDMNDRQYTQFRKNIQIFKLLTCKKVSISWFKHHYNQQFILN